MKTYYKILTSLCFCLISIMSIAQQNNYSYTEFEGDLSNPERGWYMHTETSNSNYTSLTPDQLDGYRNSGKTLVFRKFNLDGFSNSLISITYLKKITDDLEAIRNAGLKVIIRFSYTDSATRPYGDATKIQILDHLADTQLGSILRDNADIIAVMQAGFIGAWGEWYYSDNFGDRSAGTLTNQNISDRRDILNRILEILPNDRSVQLRTVYYKQELLNTTTAVTEAQAFATPRANVARVGLANDCFLGTFNDQGTYMDLNLNTAQNYLEDDSQFVITGGETCASGQLESSQNNCTVAEGELDKFHWSYINHNRVYENPTTLALATCRDRIGRNLGYRFVMNRATLDNSSNKTDRFDFNLRLKNVGYSAPFNPRGVELVFRNVNNPSVIFRKVLPGIDVRSWYKESELTEIVVDQNLAVNDMQPGTYEVLLNLPDSYDSLDENPNYSIRLANNGMWEGNTGYNKLNHQVTITESGKVTVNSKINGQPGKVFYRADKCVEFSPGFNTNGKVVSAFIE